MEKEKTRNFAITTPSHTHAPFSDISMNIPWEPPLCGRTGGT